MTILLFPLILCFVNAGVQKYLEKQDDVLSYKIKTEWNTCKTIICIPAYNEEFKDLKDILESIYNAKSIDNYLLVLVLINHHKNSNPSIVETNQSCFQLLKTWIESKALSKHIETLCFLHEFESHKKSGVGFARKLLMDTALSIFYTLKVDGNIVNLDADTIVDINYLREINKLDLQGQQEAIGFHFLHDLNGVHTNEIMQYELHLRYFINMQRLLMLPYAYQTIGSAMLVIASAYAKEGGMVKKQAGEDFYFLHKYIRKLCFADAPRIVVYPSGRTSDRVPFGTGKAVMDHLANEIIHRKTYNPQSFLILKEFLNIKNLYEMEIRQMDSYLVQLNDGLHEFLKLTNAKERLIEIKSQTTEFKSFYKRFFRWFDAFLLMKYLHHMRDYGYEDQNLNLAVGFLFSKLNLKRTDDLCGDLEYLRLKDQQRNYFNEVQLSIQALV